MSAMMGNVEAEIFGLLSQLDDVHSRLEKALQNAAGDAPYGAYLETLLAGRRQLKANSVTRDKGTQTRGPGELFVLLKPSKMLRRGLCPPPFPNFSPLREGGTHWVPRRC